MTRFGYIQSFGFRSLFERVFRVLFWAQMIGIIILLPDITGVLMLKSSALRNMLEAGALLSIPVFVLLALVNVPNWILFRKAVLLIVVSFVVVGMRSSAGWESEDVIFRHRINEGIRVEHQVRPGCFGPDWRYVEVRDITPLYMVTDPVVSMNNYKRDWKQMTGVVPDLSQVQRGMTGG